jgi:hypothetical protein
MKQSIFLFFLSSALLSAAPVGVAFLNAGTPAQVRGNDYVGPYTLGINGVATPAMCMDDFLEVYNGDQWTANVTNAASSDYGKTYLGNGGMQIYGQQFSSSDIYHAEAYLFSLIVKPGADRSDIQEAAWAIMDTNTLNQVVQNNDTAVENYLYAAAENYKTFDASGYSIISQVGPYSNCSKQEFMVASTPEPGTFALLGAAFLIPGSARFFRRKRK